MPTHKADKAGLISISTALRQLLQRTEKNGIGGLQNVQFTEKRTRPEARLLTIVTYLFLPAKHGPQITSLNSSRFCAAGSVLSKLYFKPALHTFLSQNLFAKCLLVFGELCKQRLSTQLSLVNVAQILQRHVESVTAF